MENLVQYIGDNPQRDAPATMIEIQVDSPLLQKVQATDCNRGRKITDILVEENNS
jgi:hypothetical protein